MIDPDLMILTILLVLVIAVILTPPGPGTPLRCPVPNR
jgi:hypothetical protein